MRQFPAYTLSGLRAESAELLGLLEIEAAGRPEAGQDEDEEGGE